MAPKETTTDRDSESLPFGALPEERSSRRASRRSREEGESETRKDDRERGQQRQDDQRGGGDDGAPRKKRRTRRGGRRRRKRRESAEGDGATEAPAREDAADGAGRNGAPPKKKRSRGRSRRKGKGGGDDAREPGGDKSAAPREVTGMFFQEKGGISVLRREDKEWLPSKEDVYVPKRLVQKEKLRDGMMVRGRVSRGHKHKLQLDEIFEIDGKEPRAWKNLLAFQSLTSIDPDFHYAVGDLTDDVSMRVLDLLAPVGRGQRGLLVAPPRSGKTTILRQFAAGIEKGYPDVHLMVLLVDERPEEATEWRRSVERGHVYVSTADETSKHHIQVAEMVWKRACRLVETGEDVVLLLDSITRLARAYNNQAGAGRTMSGGLDSRAMERPRKIFGSARNTVEAGSLTILGTTLVETGSRMDQLVFEEFKGTGNMELVLSRKLADRRIFPAIDVERSGTRKEEKLVGMRRLKLIHTLRRVLARMHFAEALELLITRLEDVEKTDDFLERFAVDPDA